MMLSDQYQKINSSIVSEDAMNKFKEMFPLARMFPLAIVHTTPSLTKNIWWAPPSNERPSFLWKELLTWKVVFQGGVL